MRVLQIGIGRWGQNHLRAWRRLGAELRLCDRQAERLAAEPEPGASDPRALLDAVDAVDVVTLADSHEALAALALQAGKHVFVEKPLAPGPDAAYRLSALAERRGRILQVGHVFRFAPELRALRAALEAGRIGEPHQLTARFVGFKRPRSDGGVAISDAIHFVDLACWLFGRAPGLVTGILHDALGRGVDDACFLTLDYGEALAHIEAGYFAPVAKRELVVVGSEGALVCDLLAERSRLRLHRQAHRRGDGGGWQAPEGEAEELAFEPAEPLLGELEAFQTACREGRPSRVAADGAAGALSVAIVEAAIRSAEERRSVELKRTPSARGAS